MKGKPVFTGSATALITPFTRDGLNFSTLDRLIDFQIEGGADAIVVAGTTGECVTLSFEERSALTAHTVKRVNGRIPVITGTGTNETDKATELSKAAMDCGADALLVVTPYYNKTSQRGLVKYFHDIASAVSVPVIAYNVPSRTALNILPETMAKIAEHENVVGVKEACGNIKQIAELARLCPGLDIYSGDDDHVLPILSLGGKGVITTVGNIFPGKLGEMYRKYIAGDVKGALEIQLWINPLVNAIFTDVNPIPVKTALGFMGYEVGELRPPLCGMDEKGEQALRRALVDYALI